MASNERRELIIAYIKASVQPISANALASKLNVSRQAIVGDVALLRASGADIVATPRGYVIQGTGSKRKITRTIACIHPSEDTEKELYTIVDNGGGVDNVIVEHPIYGQLCGELHVYSRYDADNFIKKTKTENAPLLSKLTDGVHLHTISCHDEQALERILAALEAENFLYQKD